MSADDPAAAPSRPRLLILSFSHIASDARVLRQVRLFAGRYEVTTCGYGPVPAGAAHHVQIPDDVVHWHKDRALLLQRRYAEVYRRGAAIAHLRPLLPVGHYDVVLADDADTVPLALMLRPRGGVHADLHEYASRQNEQSRRWRLFVAPYYRWLLARFVTACQSVTTVGQGLADEYRAEFGIRAGVVVNAAPFRDAAPMTVGDPVRLVHSGLARRSRRLEIMVDAVAGARRPVTLDLYLVPNDPAYLAELRERAALEPRITIHEPVAPDRLVETLAAYDLGIFVVPPVTFNLRWTLPNKFFDFVQARLGIVVGPSPEMARLVRRHRLGVVADGFDVAALTRVLDGLTPADVAGFKHASHAAARDLAAENQVLGWTRAVDALAARA